MISSLNAFFVNVFFGAEAAEVKFEAVSHESGMNDKKGEQ